MDTGVIVWNLVTSFFVALVMFMIKMNHDEQKRIQILLNRTREEIARDHITRAGNYTKPGLRKKIVAQVKAAATHGTGAGKWSARKAQLVAKKYKQAGGGYRD